MRLLPVRPDADIHQQRQVDPRGDAAGIDQHIGQFGFADVGQAVAALKACGVEFVESTQLHPEDRGALTRATLGSVAFELVHQ